MKKNRRYEKLTFNRFLFNCDLPKEVNIDYLSLRTEDEYSKDCFAELSALKAVKHLIKSYGENRYLLKVSENIALPSKLRSKKGLLWNFKELKNLKHYEGEVTVNDRYSRLYALIELKDFEFNDHPEFVLSWISSLIILSPLNINELHRKVEGWIATRDSVLPYDFDSMANDLASMEKSIVIRYFPADNGRSEIIGLIGNKEEVKSLYLNNKVLRKLF